MAILNCRDHIQSHIREQFNKYTQDVEEDLFGIVKNVCMNIINLSPYATYKWDISEQPTRDEISAKGERQLKDSDYNITTISELRDRNILDFPDEIIEGFDESKKAGYLRYFKYFFNLSEENSNETDEYMPEEYIEDDDYIIRKTKRNESS